MYFRDRVSFYYSASTYSLFSLIVHRWARGLKVDYYREWTTREKVYKSCIDCSVHIQLALFSNNLPGVQFQVL